MPYTGEDRLEKQRIVARRWYQNNKEKAKQQIRKRKVALKEWLREYKESRACEDCGFTGPSWVFDFNHRDPKTKDFNISKAVNSGLSKERVMKEIEKCEFLCANCHRKKTHSSELARIEMIQWYVAEKTKGSCVVCGEDDYWCIDFHHIDPETKVETVSNGFNRGWSLKRLKEEVSKCHILCINCHRAEHYKEHYGE